MRPNRREFLLSAGGLALGLFPLVPFQQRVVFLQANTAYTVSGGERLAFPGNASKGDRIGLAVTAESLLRPAVVLYRGIPLLGAREDLQLDSLGNVLFTFYGQWAGWDFWREVVSS